MGVHGLWELLAPVGRRVSVETLTGKKLAIDASIWMVQFMKAMRDEKGEMVRNGHLLGFFRRICKLLFLRTKPVFVFDGGTPALKRRTVIARRRQRENAQAKIRKTAEKLLLNHLKAMRLKEIAKDIENQRHKNDKKGKNVAFESTEVTENSSETDAKVTGEYARETLDAMLAASLAAEEGASLTGNASDFVDGSIAHEEEEGDEDGDEEEMVLVIALKDLEEILEHTKFALSDILLDFKMPVMHGKIDPAVLAALPPSMQLDLLVQMRERLMAENRQKYQKVKKVPAKFSELQIQAYLKTVAFRREIDEVQKSASGKGVGGVQTSRIASEANREFIFSSSFSGDKQTLMSAGVDKTAEVEKNGDNEYHTLEKEHISSESVNCVSSTAQPGSMTGSEMDEPSPSSCLGNDVETYVDERGRLRVSRVRAMGIRMTRDIQRNLDFLKEIEKDKLKEGNSTETEDILDKITFSGINNSSVNNHLLEAASDEGNNGSRSLNGGIDKLVQGESSQVLEKRTAFEISFFGDEKDHHGTDDRDDDDDLFAQLAAGSSVNVSSSMNNLSGKHSDGTSSDCSREEGFIEENGSSVNNDVEEEGQISLANENVSDNELDWEDGALNVPDIASLTPSVQKKGISKGSLEEEADIQEAIRRSMEDFAEEKSTTTLNKKENIEIPRDIDNHNKVAEVLTPEKENIDLRIENDLVLGQPSCEAVSGLEEPDRRDDSENLRVNDPIENQFASSIEPSVKHHEEDLLLHESSNVGILSEEGREYRNVLMEIPCGDSVGSNGQKGVRLTVDQCVDTLKDGRNGVTSSARDSSHVSAAVMGENEITEVSNVDALGHGFVAAPACHSYEAIGAANLCEEPWAKHMETDVNVEQKLVTEKNLTISEMEIKQAMDQSASQDEIEARMMVSEASLDEEMLLLRQERANLGDEQRKLERNAESVSSEMFAECQELLQMFGLPYIIAPMEAEAQCAYMELANLVDGVVTDDSDVFLFGAQSVYKNIFDNRKYVETYFMKDIESELGLSREKLIRMALLLGSDYTEGVSGIGIVNAIEVVNAFPEEGGLQNFREWLESPDPSILGKLDGQTGSVSRKRGSKVTNDEMDSSNHNMEVGSSSNGSLVEDHNDEHSRDNTDNIRQIFMDKHRNVSKNWHIPSSFPSEAVISEYVSPQVDKSTEPFSWGKPDLFVLRNLCWEKFGWSNHKADELLLPVLKEYNKHETQLRLEAFYTFNERFAKIRSKRIKKAVKGIAGNQSSDMVNDRLQEGSKSRKRRKVSLSEQDENKSENPGTVGSESNILEKSTPRQSRKRKTVNETLPSEERNSETLLPEENTQSTSKKLRRERGRGRGRGRGKIVEREKKVVNRHEPSSSSSSGGSDYHDEQEDMPVEKTEMSSQVRRSTRPRKQIKYATNGSETGSLSESSDQNDPKCTEEVVEQEAVIKGRSIGGADDDIRKTDEDSMQNDDSLGDYIETGGGFCLDEAEPESEPVDLVSCPVRVSFKDDMDYNKMGGGFCMDEGEPDTDPAPSSSGPQTGSCGHLDGGKMDVPCATRNPDSPDNVHKYYTKNVGLQPGEELQRGDSGAVSTTGLTPMPFLRRKRRKSQNK